MNKLKFEGYGDKSQDCVVYTVENRLKRGFMATALPGLAKMVISPLLLQPGKPIQVIITEVYQDGSQKEINVEASKWLRDTFKTNETNKALDESDIIEKYINLPWIKVAPIISKKSETLLPLSVFLGGTAEFAHTVVGRTSE